MIKLSKILFMFVALLGLSANSSAADVTMRISIQLPMKSHLGQNLLLFKNDVEKKELETAYAGVITNQKGDLAEQRSGPSFFVIFAILLVFNVLFRSLVF